MELAAFFAEHPKAAIAFSGGVDSVYLLYAAVTYGKEIHAYYVNSAFQPTFERRDAIRAAKELGAEMTVLDLDILSEPEITRNPADRCYYCKKKIFSTIYKRAAADGYSLLLDGTNASDDTAERPGMRALAELEVRSPLRECGLSKTEIRLRSRNAGLFTWDKPAYACLATRIPAGTGITKEQLQKTEKAEEYLTSLGLSDFRVRIFDMAARIQVTEADIELVISNRREILAALKKYYTAVVLDLEVRNERFGKTVTDGCERQKDNS